jgi:hypothetical protein
MILKMALVTDSKWGSITVGQATFRDVVITPDGCRQWNWGHICGDPMHHNPGIRTKDLDKLIIPCKPEAVVLSRGRDLVLQVNPIFESYLEGKGVKQVYILETSRAITKYNELIQNGVRVAALIHTTC